MQDYRLSPTGLALFRSCPRCFWLQLNEGLKPPTAPCPSFMSALELQVKRYFDRFRASGSFPPEVREQLAGQPFADLARLCAWRDPARGIRLSDRDLGVELVGVLDDVVVTHDVYLPLVYHSRGTAPRPHRPPDSSLRLDCCALLLESNGLAGVGVGYRLCYAPHAGQQGQSALAFSAERVSTNPARAWQSLRQALGTLRGPLPAPSARCRRCGWLQQLQLLDMLP